MKKSSIITTSLANEVIFQLNEYAEKFKIPKNKILEEALNDFFKKIKRAEYIHSFKKAANDEENLFLAEEGLSDYLKILDE